jgi:hypothetical protein
MSHHLFKYNEYVPGLFDSMIERMLMRPLEYDLDTVVHQANTETVTEEDFFTNYRIFRVTSTHSTCYRHVEIPCRECYAAPMQDILIAHIDEPVGEENNELLMQYQVKRNMSAFQVLRLARLLEILRVSWKA